VPCAGSASPGCTPTQACTARALCRRPSHGGGSAGASPAAPLHRQLRPPPGARTASTKYVRLRSAPALALGPRAAPARPLQPAGEALTHEMHWVGGPALFVRTLQHHDEHWMIGLGIVQRGAAAQVCTCRTSARPAPRPRARARAPGSGPRRPAAPAIAPRASPQPASRPSTGRGRGGSRLLRSAQCYARLHLHSLPCAHGQCEYCFVSPHWFVTPRTRPSAGRCWPVGSCVVLVLSGPVPSART